MTLYKCKKCKDVIDDKYYLQANNRLGLEETLLRHAENHKNDELVVETFTIQSKGKVME